MLSGCSFSASEIKPAHTAQFLYTQIARFRFIGMFVKVSVHVHTVHLLICPEVTLNAYLGRRLQIWFSSFPNFFFNFLIFVVAVAFVLF